jgi:integrase
MPRVSQPKSETKFMIDLRNNLVNKNKLAIGTADLYITKLKKLNDNKPFTNFTFLKNTKKMKDLFDSYENDNTRKSYVSAVVATLNYSDMKQYKSVNMFYKSLLAEVKKEYDDKPRNVMSNKQEENWLEWNDVKKIYNELKDKVENYTPELLEKSASAKKTYQDFILLSLYVAFPPRRNADYYLMKIDNNNNMNEDFNYYKPKTKQFIFNKFKTAKTYSTEKSDISNTLTNILNKYIEDMDLKDEDFLLFPNDKARNNSSNITKHLNRIFKKNIGSSMLRHIYITSELGGKIKELKDISEKMGHSSSTQSDYVLNK